MLIFTHVTMGSLSQIFAPQGYALYLLVGLVNLDKCRGWTTAVKLIKALEP